MISVSAFLFRRKVLRGMELKEKEGKPFSYTDMTAEMWSLSVGILLVAEKRRSG